MERVQKALISLLLAGISSTCYGFNCSRFDRRKNRCLRGEKSRELCEWDAATRTCIPKLDSSLKCPAMCTEDASNCDSPLCAQCEFTCSDQCNFKTEKRLFGEEASRTLIIDPTTTCRNTCQNEEFILCETEGCGGCDTCIGCPFTFQDVTSSKFRPSNTYWNQWEHSGRPYPHFTSPAFVDLDDDGTLDYFYAMHAHEVARNGYNRMELALTNANTQELIPVSDRVIINDVELEGIDTHGQNVLDLDGDGIMDIMVSSGGYRGKGELEMLVTRDNFLFWGEKAEGASGEEITIFRGGRDTARKAGVHMRYGRGRVNYIFDADGDGLLDIFCLQDRRRDNRIAPGILLINQGDRTWKEDPSFSEFAQSMILSDVDGDGVAQEILIHRGHCYPQRAGPETDTSTEEMAGFGPYQDDVLEFCSTRPIGTIAVFKYDKDSNRMRDISRTYKGAIPEKQPACCPLGSHNGFAGCVANKIISGDFDGDLLADHIMLFASKMVFYFSSDRVPGQMPIAGVNSSAEIYFPTRCNRPKSFSLVDLDNDGKEELLVYCVGAAEFLLYRQGSRKDDWTLHKWCNGEDGMGDLRDSSIVGMTEEDIADSCELEAQVWKDLRNVCKAQESSRMKLGGVAVIDLNNDGFIDVVASYAFGYMRFFENVPSEAIKNNRFISFKLQGGGGGNAYGIGATLILRYRVGADIKTQFREYSSHQNTDNFVDNKDDRIMFGLGRNGVPQSIQVTWGNGDSQNVQLDDWTFTGKNEPVELVQS